MAFVPISRTGYTEQIYREILDAILVGTLKPGEKLDIAKLAENFEVSRQPVKEAINRLSTEGLIVVRPQRGTYVRTITKKEAVDILRVRMMMETWAVTHVEQLDNELLDMLEAFAVEMKKLLVDETSDWTDYNENDIYFHQTLVKMCGNPELTRSYEALHSHYVTARFYYKDRQESRRRDLMHFQILSAIKAQDFLSAGQLVSAHIQEAINSIEKFY